MNVSYINFMFIHWIVYFVQLYLLTLGVSTRKHPQHKLQYTVQHYKVDRITYIKAGLLSSETILRECITPYQVTPYKMTFK